MTKKYFGTDGTRAVVGKYPLTPSGAQDFGKAAGSFFKANDGPIYIGYDTRESSASLAEAFAAGIATAGIDVVIVGICPTPAIPFLVLKNHARAAALVTASHNPAEFNGYKFFDSNAEKLTDQDEIEIEKLLDNPRPDSSTKGKVTKKPELLDDYKRNLIDIGKSLGSLKGLKIVVDTANGGASYVAPKVFKELGAHVTAIFNQPNGRNINEGCGSTAPQTIQNAVTASQNSVGVAFDGDADRVILVDQKGRILDGDHLLFINAAITKPTGVVGTVMTNMGLEISLAKDGVKFTRTPVGDRYVSHKLKELHKEGWTVGSEPSGHIILYDYMPTGDGLLAALVTLCLVQQSNQSLAAWRDKLQAFVQKMINVPFTGDTALLDKSEVKTVVDKAIKDIAGNGRIIVRPSGTEPVVRVTVEAINQTLADKVAGDLAEKISQLIQ